MSINPMQRKARISFILGMVITLVVTGAIIALLTLKLLSMIKAENDEKEQMTNVYVLKQDIKSGQIIDDSILEKKAVPVSMVPQNAAGSEEELSNWTLEDKEGNQITVTRDGDDIKYYLNRNNRMEEIFKYENGDEGDFYIKNGEETQQIILTSSPKVAKVNMLAKTILTKDLVTTADSTVQDDVRKQEYNVVILPTDLESGDIVDIRATFPNGQDFVVVAKKQVEIPVIEGVDSVNTFFVNLSEDETLFMNSAIVEVAKIKGSKLYLTRYTDPGLQNAATPNYVPNTEVLNELRIDATVLEKAKTTILSRIYSIENGIITNNMNNASGEMRSNIENELNNEDMDPQANLESKMQESITNSQESRKKYVEALTDAE